MVSSQKTDILDSNFDLHRKWCGILNENACGNQKYQVNYVCGASNRFAYFGLTFDATRSPRPMLQTLSRLEFSSTFRYELWVIECHKGSFLVLHKGSAHQFETMKVSNYCFILVRNHRQSIAISSGLG